MATVRQYAGRGATIAQALTNYLAWGNGAHGNSATESVQQATARTAGTFSNLYSRVTTNTLTGSSTIRVRKNTADGNGVLSISAGTTGEFEDTSNTDTITAADVMDYSIVNAAGGTSIIIQGIGGLFAATSNTSSRLLCGSLGGSNITTASTTLYSRIAGFMDITATEANHQIKFHTAGTLANMGVRVTANARTATTLNSRIGGVTGNAAVSITASTTGFFEDTTNTDSVAVNDLVNVAFVTGTGVATLTCSTVVTDFTTTNNKMVHAGSANTGGTAQNVNLTRYNQIQARQDASTTEATVQTKLNAAATLSNMQLYISANTLTATSTWKFRTGSANGNQTISIGSGATGYFEDTSNTDVVAATDEINYQFITGATGTSITTQSYAIMADYTQASAVNSNFFLMF